MRKDQEGNGSRPAGPMKLDRRPSNAIKSLERRSDRRFSFARSSSAGDGLDEQAQLFISSVCVNCYDLLRNYNFLEERLCKAARNFEVYGAGVSREVCK